MAVTLFVKGSNDHFKAHSELGDCPSCLRILLILRLKGINFQQEFVDLNKKDPKKWEDFVRRSQGRLKVPVLIHGDLEPMEDSDAIETYLENNFPTDLQSSNSKADEAGRDLYSKFAIFMRNSIAKNDAELRTVVNKKLGKLNEFLEKESPGAYLDGENLKLPDCNLLPKLMHVKVAGELKGFTIPSKYGGVLTYLEKSEKQQAFQDTFTESVKNEIKFGWMKKAGNLTPGTIKNFGQMDRRADTSHFK